MLLGGENMLNIVYKDKEYTWEEWQEMNQNFNELLQVPKKFLINPFVIDAMPIYDKGYSVALSIVSEIYYVLMSAHFNLRNAYNKVFESNFVSQKNDYLAHIWTRSEFLKNSVLMFNSIEDYVLQVIWFAYDMYNFDIKSKVDYHKALKKCKYSSVKKFLNEVNTEESHYLLNLIENYRKNELVENLRENLANNLKHRGNIQFEGIERTRFFSYVEESDEGDLMFTTKWLEPLIFDIDETIDMLVKINEISINFIEEVIDFINFFEAFDMSNVSIFGPVQIKSLIKRI